MRSQAGSSETKPQRDRAQGYARGLLRETKTENFWFSHCEAFCSQKSVKPIAIFPARKISSIHLKNRNGEGAHSDGKSRTAKWSGGLVLVNSEAYLRRSGCNIPRPEGSRRYRPAACRRTVQRRLQRSGALPVLPRPDGDRRYRPAACRR
jgi:hypothetical protein